MTNRSTRLLLLAALALGADAAPKADADPLAASPCAVPSFAAGVPLLAPGTTGWASLVGIGDVNGDGAPDVALAASTEEAIRVFRNDGRGGFAFVETVPVGTRSFVSILADVDSDGRADLVAIRTLAASPSGTASLAVWLSAGDSFRPPTETAPALPASIAVPISADVDEDGKRDLLTCGRAGAMPEPPACSWLRNLGEGRFESPRGIPAASGLEVRAAADMNGDGHVDLVASRSSGFLGELTLLSGNGSGGFAAGAPFATGQPVHQVVVADLDRNGRPDLAVSGDYRGIGGFETLISNGSGGFDSSLHVEASSSSLAVGDVDRDGIPDLAVSSPVVDLSVFLGDGRGGSRRRFRVEPSTGEIALADFDRDGALDLLRVGGAPESPAYVLRNNCTSEGTTRTLLVPVVASLPGVNGVAYRSSLTLTNRSPATTVVEARFTSAEGATGTGWMTVAGDGQATWDVEDLVRSIGVSLPEPARVFGTLRLTASPLASPDDFAAEAWVSVTRAGDVFPSSGVSFAAIPVEKAFDGTVLLGGLREDGRDRTNLGLVHAGAPGEEDVVLRVTLFPGDPAAEAPVVLPDVRLGAGRVTQLDRVLHLAGLSSTHAFARVEQIQGASRFFAYAVVNDEGSSDGSFLPALPAGKGRAERRLVVPTVVEAGTYATDLFLANASPTAKSVRLEWVASGVSAPTGSVVFPTALPPGSQLLLDDVVDRFRAFGAAGIPPRGANLAGALFVSVEEGDVEGLLAGSRVTTAASAVPGRYGVYLPAAHPDDLATGTAFLPVSQDGHESGSRANLAVVNAGEAGAGPASFRVDVWDGSAREHVLTETVLVPERGFLQLSPLVPPAAWFGNLVVTVTRTSGTAPFLAYAVVNDGARQGEGTGDGAVTGMRVVPAP